MKYFYLLLFGLFSVIAHAQRPFITKWEATNPYRTIQIPTKGGGYNYNIDFGDGTVQNNVTGPISHTYTQPGIYSVSISGSFPRIDFSSGNYLNGLNLKSVDQWGDILWHSMESAFRGCRNLTINATDAPNLSQVTDMRWMMQNTDSFNQPINHWDVSNVTNMRGLFDGAILFNQPLNQWNVSNVTDMAEMFINATSFNQPLSSWNVSNVTNLKSMFEGAVSFNQSINNWNISNVTLLEKVFKGATSFNQPLDNWNVSNATNLISIFENASAFNQSINTWNIGNVTQIGNSFKNATAFNKPLNNWNTSNITSFYGVFEGATSFNQSIDNWDVKNALSFDRMFMNATKFNQPLSGWQFTQVSSMGNMFEGATSFNQPLNSWSWTNPYSTTAVVLNRMFAGATSFNQPLDNWNVSDGSKYGMFSGATSFNQDLSSWGFIPYDNYSSFIDNSGLDISNYEALLQRFVQLNIQGRTLGANGLLYCDATSRQVLLNNMGWSINGDNIYTYCNNLDSFITQWNISPNDLSITIPTSGTGYNYNIDFGDGYTESNVTGNTTHTYTQPGIYTVMISGGFPRIHFNNSGDKHKIIKILQWGNIQWQSMEQAFSGCSNLVIEAIDSPDLSLVTNMSSMFAYATHFNSSINDWDVSNVTDMSYMFRDAVHYRKSLNNWDVSNVVDMTDMFSGASHLNQDFSTWAFNPSVMLLGFVSHSGMNISNYELLLNSFNDAGLLNKTLNANALYYCDSTIRNNLVNNFNWTILGDTQYPNCSNIDAFISTWSVTADDLTINFAVGQEYSSYANIDFGDGTVLLGVTTANISHTYTQPGIYTVSITGTILYFQATAKILTVEQWGSIKWKRLNGAFSFCPNFTLNALDKPDLSQATSLSGMFNGATAFNQPIEHWDVSNITEMEYMFSGATSFNQPLNNWDVSNTSNINDMFRGATSFNQPLNNWNVSNLTMASNAFKGATSFNQPLNNWEVANVISMNDMFLNAIYFNQDLSNWHFNQNVRLEGFISQSGLDASNYTALLARFKNLGLQNKVLDAKGMLYCDTSSRNNLTTLKGWNITGDSYLVDCNATLVPGAFVTLWHIVGNQPLTISTIGGGYNYNIDFGDGTVLTNQTSDVSHSYTSSGVHRVSITGDFPQMHFNSPQQAFKLKAILQWGNNPWRSMEKAFKDCINMRLTATDIPNLSQVTNMSSMFENNEFFNFNINNWDVSNVTNMEKLFWKAKSFNQPLNDWNVSNVTNMSGTFAESYEFNQPLNNWNVSNVLDMAGMFYGFFSMNFNQDLSDWNVSQVTNMNGMFMNCDHFNQPLNNWNVANVTDMARMFEGAKNFNQPLNNWNVSNVTDMSRMFASNIKGQSTFNQPINTWNVSNVTKMGYMFYEGLFNQPINNWDVSTVTEMLYMFEKSHFNQPLDNWNVSNVTTMFGMFQESHFNQPLNTWNVANVKRMQKMFYKATRFNQNLNNWNFNLSVNLTDFVSFSNLDVPNYDSLLARFHNLGLQNKNLGAVNLYYCDSTVRDDLIINFGWNINGDSLFSNCGIYIKPFTTTWQVTTSGNLSITVPTVGSGYNYSIDFGDRTWNTNVTGNSTHTFSQPGIYTVRIVGDFPRIYFNGEGDKDKILSVEQWGEIEWSSMVGAFNGCENLVINASDSPDLSQMSDMSFMFYKNESFNDPINNWDVSNITNMTSMFEGATSFNQPLNSWNVSNVTNMKNMFKDAHAFNQSLLDWNVSNVTNMHGLFLGANSFNQTLENWNVSSVSDMGKMFKDAAIFNQSLNNWDTSNTTNMMHMFENATAFDQDISTWNFNNNVSLEGFLSFSGLGTANYDPLLARFVAISLQNKTLGAQNLIFCEDVNRRILINNLGWTINGDNQDADCSLSISDNILNNISVYPNPTKDILYIKTSNNVQITAMAIYDIAGQVVVSFSTEELVTQKVKLENLSSGIYILKAQTDKGVQSLKIIKD